MYKLGLSAALILSLAGAVCAQDKPATAPAATEKQPDAKKAEKLADLMVGDKAPALSIEKWIKGEPVTGFEKGKVYVVEFWATWCGPCIAGMPHLSEVQEKFKDKGLTIIGVTSKDPRNTLEKAEQMAKDKGDKMGYTVAWDTERKTNEAYLRAAKQNFIPCAFVVDKEGMVAWIGNPNVPTGGFETTIEEIIAGKHDLKAAATKYRESKADELVVAGLQGDFSKAMRLAQEGKFDDAVTGIDKLMGKSKEMDNQLVMAKLNILLVGKKDFDKGYAFASEAATKYKADSMMLNAIAWSIVDPEAKVEKRDVDVALRIATDAAKASGEKDGAILDTLARCHWLKGDKAKAIEIQKKAIAIATPEFKEQLEETLAEYEKSAK